MEIQPYTPPYPRPPTNSTTEGVPSKHAVPRAATLIAVLPHGEVVCSVALSHPFGFVYTGGRGVVKIWDVNAKGSNGKGVLVGSIDCLDNYIRACHITRDSKTMIVAGEARHMVVVDISTVRKNI